MLNQYETELHSIFKKFETLETMPTKDQIKEAFAMRLPLLNMH